MLGATQRERWIANTLAGLAEVALLRGDVERAAALLADARERYASRDDAARRRRASRSGSRALLRRR